MKLKGIELRKFNVYRLGNLSEERKVLKFPYNEENLIYKIITKDNLKDIISTRGKNIYSRFEKFLENGEQGYYVYFEDRVIAHGWVFFNQSSSIKKCIW